MSSVMLENTHEQELSETSVDFQEHMYALGVECRGNTDAAPCAVVATVRDDMEVSALSLELAAEGIRLLRLNVDSLVDIEIVEYAETLQLVLAGELLQPRFFWARYMPDAFTVHDSGDASTALLRAYVVQHTKAFVQTIAELAPIVVNGAVTGFSRLAQQRAALLAGVRVPNSVVGRTILGAAHRINGERPADVVLKVVGEHWVQCPPGVLHGTFPRRLRRSESHQLGTEPAPLIVQEYVDHVHELRVYALAGEFVTYQVSGKSSASDLWISPESVSVTPYVLDSFQLEMMRRLVLEMRLDFGALDFLVTRDGELVFLEANLIGDWRFYEKCAGDTRVSNLVREYVIARMRG